MSPADFEKGLVVMAKSTASNAAPSDTTEFRQFLSDVMTAAGLVTHGKQCKALGDRLGAGVMKYLAVKPRQQATSSRDHWEERSIAEGWFAATPAPADPLALANLNSNSYAELRDKALYLMELNANQARTIDALQLAATPAQQTQSDAVAGADADRDAFLLWAEREGLSLLLASAAIPTGEVPQTMNGLFFATFWNDTTECAWRAWANKPSATPPQQATPSAAASIKPDVQPMTDEDAKKLIEQSDLLDMFEHIGWYSAPKKNFLKNSMTLIRAIEAAHGIRAALKEAPGGGT